MKRNVPILDMSCRHGDVVEVIPRSLEVEPCLDLVINGDMETRPTYPTSRLSGSVTLLTSSLKGLQYDDGI